MQAGTGSVIRNGMMRFWEHRVGVACVGSCYFFLDRGVAVSFFFLSRGGFFRWLFSPIERVLFPRQIQSRWNRVFMVRVIIHDDVRWGGLFFLNFVLYMY